MRRRLLSYRRSGKSVLYREAICEGENAKMNKIVSQTQEQTDRTNSQESGILQRKCACGQHAIAGGGCDGCSKKRLQRHVASQAEPTEVPPIVHEVLSSPGQPLDASTRWFMEPRFEHDFSRVRVHTGSKAAESARAVNALAYNVGDHIVFGSGEYATDTARGGQLLAHELTHVVQQGVGGGAGPYYAKAVSQPSDAAEIEAEATAEQVMRGRPAQVKQPAVAALHGLSRDEEIGIGVGAGIAGAVGLGLGIAALAGAFDRTEFSEAELQGYLRLLARTQQIENKRDSDNKARAVVNAWRLGGSAYVLTAQLKTLLIKEMQAGDTGDDDEEAVLEILERSYNF